MLIPAQNKKWRKNLSSDVFNFKYKGLRKEKKTVFISRRPFNVAANLAFSWARIVSDVIFQNFSIKRHEVND